MGQNPHQHSTSSFKSALKTHTHTHTDTGQNKDGCYFASCVAINVMNEMQHGVCDIIPQEYLCTFAKKIFFKSSLLDQLKKLCKCGLGQCPKDCRKH